MKANDRIRVSDAYGERFTMWKHIVGEEGTFHRVVGDESSFEGYLEATLDCDGEVGLFLPDELEVVR